MIKPPTTVVDKVKEDLSINTPVHPKDGFLTIIAKGLHFVLLLVLLVAARAPCFTKLKHLKTLLSIYFFVSACIINVQQSVLHALESVLTLTLDTYASCCYMSKGIILRLVVLWYRITQSLNLLEHIAAYLRSSSEDQCRSRVESSLVYLSTADEEIKQPQPISPTSSSASSFVSTPASSPRSSPTTSRTSTYIKAVGDNLSEDLSDSDNETVGTCIVKDPTFVAVVALPQTPSFSSSTAGTYLPSPTVNSTSTTIAIESSHYLPAVGQPLEPAALPVASAIRVERVVASSVDQVPAQVVQKEDAQKKDLKVANVPGKWVWKIKAMTKGKKVAKASVVV